VAAVRIKSFKEWWDGLPQATRKNVRRSQKRGVVVTVREFDHDLIRELVGLNNDSPIRQACAMSNTESRLIRSRRTTHHS